MGRRVDVAHRRLGADANRHAGPLERQQLGLGVGVQHLDPDQAALLLEHGRVLQMNRHGSLRRDARQLGGDQLAAVELEQRGRSAAAHDVGEDLVGLLDIENLGLDLLAVDDQRHLVDLGAGLDLHVASPAHHKSIVGIEECALVALDRYLVGDIDLHIVQPDLHRLGGAHEARFGVIGATC